MLSARVTRFSAPFCTLQQAPGSDEEERAWAIRKFGFEFPVFDHVAVLDKPTPQWAGPTQISSVYAFLKAALPGEIPWNYTKFLVGRDGVPLRRYSPADPLDQGMEDDSACCMHDAGLLLFCVACSQTRAPPACVQSRRRSRASR